MQAICKPASAIAAAAVMASASKRVPRPELPRHRHDEHTTAA